MDFEEMMMVVGAVFLVVCGILHFGFGWWNQPQHEGNYDICPCDCEAKGLGTWNGTISYDAGCLCDCQNGTTYGTCM
jgi:hypothetical protein